MANKSNPAPTGLTKLRDDLLDAQFEMRKSQACSVALVVTGFPTAGRSETVNKLLEWFDPKFVSVHALDSADDLGRPAMWKFWQTLPGRGRMAIYFDGWYRDYLVDALHRRKHAAKHEQRYFQRFVQLERLLRQERVHVLKLHLHVDKKVQRKRMVELRADELTRWRVTREDRWLAQHYDRLARVTRRYVRATDHAVAPWHVVNGNDADARLVKAAELLRGKMRNALKSAQGSARFAWPKTKTRKTARFQTRAAEASVSEEEYQVELERLQGRLARLTRKGRFAEHGMVLAFEGMDAAGKGGAIQRLTHALDARQFRVVPISAPTPEDLLYPYLWRFWRPIPRRGELVIYDRSWYGRVLVERVRELTLPDAWRRAYEEIREFELELSEHGMLVQKFWLAVSLEEQLARFQKRDANPLKRFKVDKEDWVNRRFYDAYQAAAQEMIDRTHTETAPWTVVPADDKHQTRLIVLRTVCETIERGL
jgi:AMP-polyphosphate phosphotransferase